MKEFDKEIRFRLHFRRNVDILSVYITRILIEGKI